MSNIIEINTISVVSKLNNPRGFDIQLLHFITWAIRILAIYHIKFLEPLPGIALILLILIPRNLNCNLTFYFSCFNFFLLLFTNYNTEIYFNLYLLVSVSQSQSFCLCLSTKRYQKEIFLLKQLTKFITHRKMIHNNIIKSVGKLEFHRG